MNQLPSSSNIPLHRVVPGIQPDEQLSVRHLVSQRQGFPEKLGRSLLTVLLAFPQFRVHKKALCAQVSKNRRVSIITFIGAGNALLGCLGVVHRRHIDIQIRQSARQWTRFDSMGRKHAHVSLQNVLPTRISHVVHPLPKRLRGRDRTDDTQRVPEEFRIVRHFLHRVVIRLSLRQQPDVRQRDIPVLDLRFAPLLLVHRDAVQPLHQVAFP